MSDTTEIQGFLVRHKAGDAKATNELFRFVESRLRIRASQMLKSDRVGRWENTDDLLQAAWLKLHKALETTQPDSIGGFYGLAALQVRRALADLGRKHFGPRGLSIHHHTDKKPADEAGGSLDIDANNKRGPKDWTKFYEAIEALPDSERQVFDLTWTNGLTYAQAAEVMGISEKTIQRTWLSIRMKLASLLDPED